LTVKNYCTGIGHAVAKAEYYLLNALLCQPAAADCGRNTIRDSELLEFADRTAELGIKHRQLATLAEFVGCHTPVVQATTNKARVGHLVTYAYDDPSGKECELKFVLGGANEPTMWKDITVFNYLAPFGAAFLGKEVGEEVRVTLNGSPVFGEITAIELLPVPDALSTEVSARLNLGDPAFGLAA
jgi:transcription elongation GreA/GreB family factor